MVVPTESFEIYITVQKTYAISAGLAPKVHNSDGKEKNIFKVRTKITSKSKLICNAGDMMGLRGKPGSLYKCCEEGGINLQD